MCRCVQVCAERVIWLVAKTVFMYGMWIKALESVLFTKAVAAGCKTPARWVGEVVVSFSVAGVAVWSRIVCVSQTRLFVVDASCNDCERRKQAWG